MHGANVKKNVFIVYYTKLLHILAIYPAHL